MKVKVFGLGYVGSVVSICLASTGHEVIGCDVIKSKVNKINNGELDIFEPGLKDMLQQVLAGKYSGSLQCEIKTESEKDAEVAIVCVGTPSKNSGAIDLSPITETVVQLGAILKKSDHLKHIIIRSTIPPGTTEDLIIPILEKKSGKLLNEQFYVSFYPEFLREGKAIHDFLNPSLNVVGSTRNESFTLISSLFKNSKEPVQVAYKTAEMIKYANNTFHALKVVFGNELGAICMAQGVDSDELIDLFCSDNVLNISPYYLKPGFAFGGSCLPKEVRGITHLSRSHGIKPLLLESILPSNQEHCNRLLEILEVTEGKTVVFFGVAFKPDTDDLRESPLLDVIKTLMVLPSYKKSKDIKIFEQKNVCEKVFSHFNDEVECISSQTNLVKEADLIILGPQPLEKGTINDLLGFKGKLIDLKWHKVPASLKKLSGYTVIC